MKLLYVSSYHATLERDDLKLFTEMNIDWFSTGFYLEPRKPWIGHIECRSIDRPTNNDVLREFKSINNQYKYLGPIILNKAIIDQFDAIYLSNCNPYPYFIRDNWNLFKSVIDHKPIFYRTYAQHTAHHELELQSYRQQGLKLIRNAPSERKIQNYAGDDAIIRGYVDETIYNNWSGEDRIVLTFNNDYVNRSYHSNTPIYERIRQHLNKEKFELYGAGNEKCSLSLGYLDDEKKNDKYRKARIYFSLGSKPASATYNAVEAMMTGSPIVTWGKWLGNARNHPYYGPTYEMNEVIKNGVSGLASDSEAEIIKFITAVLNDTDYAKYIGENARQTAISIWGKETIKKSWVEFFKGLGFDDINSNL